MAGCYRRTPHQLVSMLPRIGLIHPPPSGSPPPLLPIPFPFCQICMWGWGAPRSSMLLPWRRWKSLRLTGGQRGRGREQWGRVFVFCLRNIHWLVVPMSTSNGTKQWPNKIQDPYFLWTKSRLIVQTERPSRSDWLTEVQQEVPQTSPCFYFDWL